MCCSRAQSLADLASLVTHLPIFRASKVISKSLQKINEKNGVLLISYLFYLFFSGVFYLEVGKVEPFVPVLGVMLIPFFVIHFSFYEIHISLKVLLKIEKGV